eukprot:Protomagalhaensia_sp_Gyna_25__4188@NODE_37_length_6764_cov_11_327881_g26_i0_p3_GENE_NODE_37_length_6764_cov_11_327881_g26_i0NODE_37_length_6764_cov_11_327881_g26_i0_p3_ORF_typecomplete_len501_score67_24bZIP_2/PF07716_15/4_3e02bZIP_2/PF07716_15/0_51_NODE_37_length_6764_cov_11_327881_g26_i012302732
MMKGGGVAMSTSSSSSSSQSHCGSSVSSSAVSSSSSESTVLTFNKRRVGGTPLAPSRRVDLDVESGSEVPSWTLEDRLSAELKRAQRKKRFRRFPSCNAHSLYAPPTSFDPAPHHPSVRQPSGLLPHSWPHQLPPSPTPVPPHMLPMMNCYPFPNIMDTSSTPFPVYQHHPHHQHRAHQLNGSPLVPPDELSSRPAPLQAHPAVYNPCDPSSGMPQWLDPRLVYVAAMLMSQGFRPDRLGKPRRRSRLTLQRRGRLGVRRKQQRRPSPRSLSSSRDSLNRSPSRRRRHGDDKEVGRILESLRRALRENTEAFDRSRIRHTELLSILREASIISKGSASIRMETATPLPSEPPLTPTVSEVSSHLVRVALPSSTGADSTTKPTAVVPGPPSSRSTASGFTDLSGLRSGTHAMSKSTQEELALRDRERKRLKVETLHNRLRQVEAEIASWMTRFKANNGGQPPTKVIIHTSHSFIWVPCMPMGGTPPIHPESITGGCNRPST